MEKLTIDLGKVNKSSLYLGLVLIVFIGIPYYFIWPEQFTLVNSKNALKHLSHKFSFFLGLVPLVFLALGVALHELIHGLTWSLFAKNGLKSIKYGIMKEYMTPYCHCTEPLKVKHYIIGGIMPAIILGIIPSLLAIYFGNFYLLIFGMFFTNAAIGDFLIIKLLLNENMDSEVQDHPSEAGCFIKR